MAAGFVEYFPWKGRETMYFERKWVVWPVDDAGTNAGVGGMGFDTHQTPFFGHQPIGQWATDGKGKSEDKVYAGHISTAVAQSTETCSGLTHAAASATVWSLTCSVSLPLSAERECRVLRTRALGHSGTACSVLRLRPQKVLGLGVRHMGTGVRGIAN